MSSTFTRCPVPGLDGQPQRDYIANFQPGLLGSRHHNPRVPACRAALAKRTKPAHAISSLYYCFCSDYEVLWTPQRQWNLRCQLSLTNSIWGQIPNRTMFLSKRGLRNRFSFFLSASHDSRLSARDPWRSANDKQSEVFMIQRWNSFDLCLSRSLLARLSEIKEMIKILSANVILPPSP